MSDKEAILEIHQSFCNGQNWQASEQIEEYGELRFWGDYIFFLESESGLSDRAIYVALRSAVRVYHRIRGCS